MNQRGNQSQIHYNLTNEEKLIIEHFDEEILNFQNPIKNKFCLITSYLKNHSVNNPVFLQVKDNKIITEKTNSKRIEGFSIIKYKNNCYLCSRNYTTNEQLSISIIVFLF